MAKALIFLKATDDNQTLLAQSVHALAQSIYQQATPAEQGAMSIRVMQSLIEDPLSNRLRPDHVCDVSIEIKTQPGVPLSKALEPWQQINDQCQSLMAAQASLALVMREQRWKPSAPQPICYHYLMLRRPDFSPADYADYYLNYHRRFGLITPGIEGYSQNMVDLSSSKKLCEQLNLTFQEVTSISEMHMRDIDTFMSSPAMAEIGPEAGMDESRFVDRDRSRMFCSEIIFSLGDQQTVTDSVFASE